MSAKRVVGEASVRSLVAVIALMIASALVVTLVTAPFARLLGEKAGAVPAALHGVAALLQLFVGTIGLYLGWRLLTEPLPDPADLQLLTTAWATLSLLTISLGHWRFATDAAPMLGRASAYPFADMPEAQAVFFAFKVQIALFTLPLSVCAAFLLGRYGGEVLERPWLRYTVATLVGLGFFYLVAAFVQGAAMARLRPI